MQKIVTITCQASTRPAAVPAQSQMVGGDGRKSAGQGSGSRPRGILVEFPKASTGPLYAAAIAFAVLATLATVIHA